MEEYGSHYDEEDDESLLGAIRSIGVVAGAARIPRRVAADPIREESAADEPSLGEDNYEVIMRSREAETQRRYEELKRQHQVDLNDAKQLADLEDPGLQAHMVRARRQLADHESAQASLPSNDALLAGDTEARRALSSLMTSIKSQQMALQVVASDVLLQATNAQKLAEGGRPHGFPTAGEASKDFELLGKKVAAAGEDLSQLSEVLESFERDLTRARRAYEKTVDGLTRRSQYFEKAYGETAFIAARAASE